MLQKPENKYLFQIIPAIPEPTAALLIKMAEPEKNVLSHLILAELCVIIDKYGSAQATFLGGFLIWAFGKLLSVQSYCCYLS